MIKVPRSASTWSAWCRTIRCGAGVIAGLLLMITTVVRAAPDQPSAAAAPASQTGGSVPAARFARNVAIITIDREIDMVMARSVQRRLKEAEDNGADAVVFELNTPGGDLRAVLAITRMIKDTSISNTVAWVHHEAYSGGAIIALACREIVVSSVARMGDAAPIFKPSFMPSRHGGNPLNMGETERQKILAPLLTDVIDSARRRGYDEKLVQGMVTSEVELWLIENAKTGQRLFIDRKEHEMLFGEPPSSEPLALASTAPLDPLPPAVSDDAAAPISRGVQEQGAGSDTAFIPATPAIREETAQTVSTALTVPTNRPRLSPADARDWKKIEKVSDGNTIFTFNEAQLLRYGLATDTVKNDNDLRTFFGATNVRRLDQSWSESLVVFLTHDIVRGILIVIFLVALFIEMTHPGVVLPGVVAALAFVLLIAPPLINDMASWWEIAAMLAGIILLLLEIFVIPGFGIAGVAGIVLFLLGLVGTFVGSGGLFPDSPGGRSELLSGVTTVVLSGASAFVIMWFLAKHFGQLPLLNKLVLRDDAPVETEGGLLAAMAVATSGISRGATGVALTPLRPAGRVQIGDQIIDVVSDFGFIPAGERVRVVSVDQFRVTVEPLSHGGAGGTA